MSLTAFYPCGVRATDAKSSEPIVGDQFAERFMDERGWKVIEAMRDLERPWNSILARHRTMDDRLRQALVRHPDLRVVIVGAGFDARAFRLPGGRWVEVDEAAVIEYKNAILPAEEAPNPLVRVPIDFAQQSLADVLAPYTDEARAVAVIEGVLLYLDRDQLSATARAVRGLAPSVTVLCDEMSPAFFARAGHVTHDRLQRFGAPFQIQHVDVPAVWRAEGFREVQRTSIPVRMAELGRSPLPRWLLETFLRSFAAGYVVAEWESVRR
ncbi:MAG TPA: SAM-dependent methyltransferase [Gemmatimonadaceae bacterium]|nr:SAM-dependent methyltransferase [Gemmatimonadaceae bacterium]